MKKRQGYTRRADLPADDVIARYQAGDSLAKIASAYGTSANTVKRVLDGQGVQRRPAHGTAENMPRTGRIGLAASLPAEEVISRYRDGASLADLASAYGVSVGTIRRVMDARGEERRSPEPKEGVSKILSPEEEAEIVRRNQRGESLRAIAASMGINKNTARNALERQSAEPSGPRRHARPDLPTDEIVKRRAAGQSARQLAAEYGVTESTINRRLQKAAKNSGDRDA